MESKKQEKYNLMHDNPVAKHASGGSWMSKHSKSAFQMGYGPLEMKSKEGNKQVDTKAIMDKSGTSYTGLTKK